MCSKFKDSPKILKLIEASQNGDTKAEGELVSIYQPYVKYVIKTYSKKTLIKDDDDLRSYIYMGLLDGIRKFDPKRNTTFIYFAHIWMKKHIFIGEADYSLIKIPANKKIFYDKFLKKYEDIDKDIQYDLEHKDILKFINIQNTKARSLTDLKSFNSDLGLIHEDKIKEDTELLKHNLNKALSSFSIEDIFVIEHTFGLNNKPILNIKEIADELEVSKVYVSAVKIKVIKLLRHSSFYSIIFKGM